MTTAAPPLALPPMTARRAVCYGTRYVGDDDYPRRGSDGAVHPMWGAYAAMDYLEQHDATGDPEFLEAARRVTDAALGRMRPYRDCLVMWYRPGGVLEIDDKVYSGLAQARYFDVLARLGYPEAEAVHRSLQLHVRLNGVLRQHGQGAIIEEVPGPELVGILNGWLTALEILARHGRTDDVERGLVALRDLLPDYDLPDEANSLYSLGGRWRRPTSWKRIGAARVNVYHEMHVRSLRALAALTGDPVLGYWADRWDGYRDRWPVLYPGQSRDVPDGFLW